MTTYLKLYLSLWISDAARVRGFPVPPAATDYLAQQAHGHLWQNELARFAIGDLDWKGLYAKADTRGKRAEAYFYQAMRDAAAGDRASAEDRLRGVVRSDMLGFFEFEMAAITSRTGSRKPRRPCKLARCGGLPRLPRLTLALGARLDIGTRGRIERRAIPARGAPARAARLHHLPRRERGGRRGGRARRRRGPRPVRSGKVPRRRLSRRPDAAVRPVPRRRHTLARGGDHAVPLPAPPRPARLSVDLLP